MAKVGATLFTMYLDTMHAMAMVMLFPYCFTIQWLIKTRPTRTRVILGVRIKQWFTTTATDISAGFLAVVILTSKSTLGTLLAADVILLIRQFGTPLIFTLLYFTTHS